MIEMDEALRAGPANVGGVAATLAERFAERSAAEGAADVAFAEVDTPVGQLLVAGTRRGVVRLAFPEEGVDDVLERLAVAVSPRIVQAPGRLDGPRRQLEEYFAGRRREFDVDVDLRLRGAFGRRVLRVARAIPYGGVSTYAEVAAAAGSPRGSRAAGGALGANPVPIIVPCHRVLRTGGGLGGYAGGLERKRFLLGLEGVAVG